MFKKFLIAFIVIYSATFINMFSQDASQFLNEMKSIGKSHNMCVKAFELIEMGDLSTAFEYFKEAYIINPKSEIPFLGIGHIFLLIKNYSKAQIYFQKSLNIYPTKLANNSIGDIYMIKNKPVLALEYYNNALSIDSLFAETHGKLGDCYNKLKNYSLSKMHYEKAIELDSQNAEYKKELKKVSKYKN